MTAQTATATGIGAAVRRKEDFRFITGKGQYTDDISRPGETRARVRALAACACEDQEGRYEAAADRCPAWSRC